MSIVYRSIVRITFHGVNVMSNNLLCPAKLIVQSLSNLMKVIIDVQVILWP